MHNLIAQAGALLLAVLIAGFSSLRLTAEDIDHRLPQRLSERKRETQMESVWKLQQVLKSNLLILNVMLLYLLATARYEVFQIIAFGFIWLIIVNVLSASRSIRRRAKRLALARLPLLIRIAEGTRPALDVLDSSRLLIVKRKDDFASKGELLTAIEKSTGILTSSEKQQLYGILLADKSSSNIEALQK